MNRKTPLIVALFLITCTAAAPAGEVVAFGGASGPGLDSMSFNNLGTPAPGNDNVGGTSPNWIAVHQKAYDAVDYIDMVFIVVDSGLPTTEYVLSEGVHNGTGIDWTDYHLELGFGTGAGFVISPPGDGLDFDAPDLDSPYVFAPFTSVTVGEDTLDAVGGSFPNGTFMVLSFPIDVPAGINEFTVRQWPTIDTVPNDVSTWGGVKALYR
jgi:hypothetical protein